MNKLFLLNLLIANGLVFGFLTYNFDVIANSWTNMILFPLMIFFSWYLGSFKGGD